MANIHITNPGPNIRYVAGVAIPPGESRSLDEGDLPPHLRPAPVPAAPRPAPDPMLLLLDNSVPGIAAQIQDRDEAGEPIISDENLARLAAAEEGGKARKSLMAAIAEEQLRRAHDRTEAQTGEEADEIEESAKGRDETAN